MRFLLCYKLQSSNCNATYYDKIKRHFKVRVSKHIGASARTGESIKSVLVCDNIVSFEDFPVFANGSNYFRTKLQESILDHRDGS